MKKILFIGGDRRIRAAADILGRSGYKIYTYGLFEEDGIPKPDFDFAVLPVPATTDGINVNCPLTGKQISLNEVKQMCSGKTILSPGTVFNGEKCLNYLNVPEYKILNAVPTAEGAIAKAIELSDSTLWGSRILIIGYGKCGRALSERLSGFKCKLTVSARSEKDLAELSALGINSIKTQDAAEKVNDFDIIFNTVDTLIFNDIEAIEKTLIIDISSNGCLDFKRAQTIGIPAYKLPGIPGKSAPETAGKILAQTLSRLIERGE